MSENIILTREQLEATIRFTAAQSDHDLLIKIFPGTTAHEGEIKEQGTEALIKALSDLNAAFADNDTLFLEIASKAERAAEAAANKTFGELAQRP